MSAVVVLTLVAAVITVLLGWLNLTLAKRRKHAREERARLALGRAIEESLSEGRYTTTQGWYEPPLPPRGDEFSERRPLLTRLSEISGVLSFLVTLVLAGIQLFG